MGLPSIAEQREPPFVSTAHPPEPDIAQRLVFDAHLRFKANQDRQNSQAYPALARDLFGVCAVGTSGNLATRPTLPVAPRIGRLGMAGLALLAVIPAGGLPDYLPREIPSDGAAEEEPV
ncbi:hypothetical protein [Bradyrhizobium sp. STM 3557]|uniref:hypothetical protein n=1 Tax=Bradyrhizobium sp. STM 3557 TaxID=578920 RepID=UPI00388D4D3B